MPRPDDDDLLSGYAAIGAHLNMTARQAKHLGEQRAIPVFKYPGSSIVRARRSTLNAFIADLEASSLRPHAGEAAPDA